MASQHATRIMPSNYYALHGHLAQQASRTSAPTTTLSESRADHSDDYAPPRRSIPPIIITIPLSTPDRHPPIISPATVTVAVFISGAEPRAAPKSTSRAASTSTSASASIPARIPPNINVPVDIPPSVNLRVAFRQRQHRPQPQRQHRPQPQRQPGSYSAHRFAFRAASTSRAAATPLVRIPPTGSHSTQRRRPGLRSAQRQPHWFAFRPPVRIPRSVSIPPVNITITSGSHPAQRQRQKLRENLRASVSIHISFRAASASAEHSVQRQQNAPGPAQNLAAASAAAQMFKYKFKPRSRSITDLFTLRLVLVHGHPPST
ncbi:hypothetical protein C8R44DRAFT_864815 [Mycena epipterygia]|nr:hypothetical protein C8R44DRAFT_864815 [Mycena epipterygia]